ncbi:amino acid ABC transporter permease [Glaciimonas sp. PCH181]|uniref:amino acid ABC transporter permease n=1 Tax=Glaciimonas sp. PCH181 TaxID=2133943 RepID=UPI000D3A7EB5|nr:amino acid ABC transporter permease [Glaciimonas sp. PCH181]PUA18691.1 glutamate ABC transporter permease [Glaciimonas sp. PCH181]
MNYSWNWHIFLEMAPGGSVSYIQTILDGTAWTLATAILSLAIAIIFGVLVGIGRTLPSKTLQIIGSIYVEIFRNIPLLVQMFLWFFVFPELMPERFGSWLKQFEYAPFLTAVVCLGLFTSSRVAEQVKSGIGALSKGQLKAGQALGLSLPDIYRLILLPQAFRLIMPPMTSEIVNLVKNTSVAMTIGLMELTARARTMQEMSFQIFESFAAATLVYLIINTIVVFGMRKIEARYSLLPKHNATKPDATILVRSKHEPA